MTSKFPIFLITLFALLGFQLNGEIVPEYLSQSRKRCPTEIQPYILSYPSKSEASDGQIMVMASGYRLEYSIDGGASYQLSRGFDGLKFDKTYDISVRSCLSGCVEYASFRFDRDKACVLIEGAETGEIKCYQGHTTEMKVELQKGSRRTQLGSRETMGYEYSIDYGKSWSDQYPIEVNEGKVLLFLRNEETQCYVVDTITIPCHWCFDGIKNGDETGVDCGGRDCHVCECPSADEVRQSAALRYAMSTVGGGPIRAHTFICEDPDYYDCPICRAYRSCHNDIDDDKTIVKDCDDPKCQDWYDMPCVRISDACDDGMDNDGDGLVDCLDPGCDDSSFCGFVNQVGGRYTEAFDNRQALLTLIRELEGGILGRKVGGPIWNKTFRRSSYVVTPVARPHDKNIRGMLVTTIREDRQVAYNLFTVEELMTAINADIRNGTLPERFKLENSLYQTVLLFCIADQKHNNGQRLVLIDYLRTHKSQKNPRLDVAIPNNEIEYCLKICTSFSHPTEGKEITTHKVTESLSSTDIMIGKDRRPTTCLNWTWVCSLGEDPLYLRDSDLIIRK